MIQAGSVLSSLFRQLGLEDRIRLETLQRRWCDLFSEPLTLHAYPAELTGQKLTINVDSPAWLHQLQFLRSDFLAKLVPFGIAAVQFRRGRMPCRRGVLRTPEKTLSPAATVEERRWAEDLVRGIDDEALKEKIRRAAEKSVARRKK
ncbi:MAG TPA: DUF721 domain-containing protein [Dissulfurispiraceae bacterium]|nr:DUF721 domain-containing protein [Dissulfurispiraceae bacterium]